MNSIFELTDTQSMLRDSLSRYLAEHHDIDQRVKLLASAERQPPLWHAFAHELGLLGASFGEAQGGMGGGAADNLVIMETLGEALAAAPYLSTVVIGGGIFSRIARESDGDLAQQMIGRIIDGHAVIAWAATEPQGRHDLADLRTTLTPDGQGFVLNGHKCVVHDAPWATDLLVTARAAGAGIGVGAPANVSLVHLDARVPGLRRRDYRTVDGGYASDLVFDAVRVTREHLVGAPGSALPLLQTVIDEATLAVCAEACGVMRRLLRDTVEYARQRRQFGSPIAGFQALQHRLADMFLALEQASALTAASAAALSAAPRERELAVSSAKVCVASACKVVGQGAVQIHGGMGMTEELAVGHYFRRATQIELLFGSPGWHLRRVERHTHTEPQAQAIAA